MSLLSDEEIHYISTRTVRPASHNQMKTYQRIDITIWDLMLLPHQYMQRGLLFTNPNPSKQSKQEMENMISHLITSLSHTLDYFFPLAGRLAITKHDDNNSSIYINCNSAGAEFIHAAANITVAQILIPTYVPRIVHSLFTLKGVMNYDGLSQPLLSVQVTELVDGIFIGCSINHTVCDGTAFWHFFNSWSKICKGSDHISHPLILKRWFPNNIDCPIRLPFSIDEHFAERYKYSTPPSFEVRIFRFAPENIARLKTKANSESTATKTDHNISSLQALLAHVWIAVTRARCLDSREETSYQLVIGNRARLNPSLPKGYFGNSFLIGEATVKVCDLLEKGIGWGALLLKQLVMSYSDAAIRSYWESWVEKPVLLALNGIVSSANLMTGGSPRFNMYGNDFGWGLPVAVRGGINNKRQGEITAIPGPVDGSVDLEVYLPLDTLKAMANDAEFMEVVNTLPKQDLNFSTQEHQQGSEKPNLDCA